MHKQTNSGLLVRLTLVCLLAHIACYAQTLRDLLVANGIPFTQLSPAALSEAVQGTAATHDAKTMLAYQVSHGDSLNAILHLLSYNKTTGYLRRSESVPAQGAVCPGAVGTLSFFSSFPLLSTHITPSAECLLVLGDDLRIHHTLYGFDPHEVYPNHITLIENMIHFAVVHPERLQLADLRSGKTTELYPPLHDPLRARLIREHRRHLPPPATCRRMDDPCDPAQFDEDIRALNTDGHGRFSFLAVQTANHAAEPGTPPETVASQAVLYLYEHLKIGWRFCEVPIAESQIEATSDLIKSGYGKVAHRCSPTTLVNADLSTASTNPFLRP